MSVPASVFVRTTYSQTQRLRGYQPCGILHVNKTRAKSAFLGINVMLMFGDQEAQDSLSQTNLRASRIRWPSVPLPVGGGTWMGMVGGHSVAEQSETHSNLAL